MFRFEHPEYLYALAILPVLIMAFALMWYLRKKAIAQFGDLPLVQRLMPEVSKYKHFIKFTLLLFALALVIVAWSNPQWGTRKEKVKRKSVDVFIALDISHSMLAEDIPPNRMERAKKFAQTLVKELKGNQIGTIIFAGNAYLQMPLTTDYAAAELFLKSANTELAPTQGTAISEAIDLAERSFDEDNKHHKVLVIITDGENHDQKAIERAQVARENGLLVFTIGVGTPEGDLIPISVGGRKDHKRDKTGNPVRTKLNEIMLNDLANAGDGAYFNLREGDKVLEALRKKIDSVEKRELETRSFSEFESYFQYFILLALIFIVVEFLIAYRKSRLLNGRDLFNV